MSNENQKTISWQAWEFKHYPKNVGWYVTLGAIGLLVVAFFVLVENDIFAAVSLGILALLILLFAKQKPQRVDIELGSKGIKFGNLFYPYKQLQFFWVVHNERHKTANFHTSAFVNNAVILELEDEDPDEVRNFLLNYLPEHSATDETGVQKIMHWVKF